MKIATLTIIGFSILLAIKLLPVPFAVVMVPTKSMYPVIKPFDLVICMGKHVKPGDIVLWCSSPLYCVIHRLVAIKGDYIITKGDANPVPDKPVPISYLKAKARLIIPSYVWVPVLAIAVILDLYRGREKLSSTSLGYIVFATGLLIAILVILASPRLPAKMMESFHQPLIHLRSVKTDGCTVTILFNPEGLVIKSVEYIGPPSIFRLVGWGKDWIRARIIDPYSIAKDNRHVSLCYRLKLTHDATLTGCQDIRPVYRPLSISVSMHYVEIVNRNCYSVPVKLVFWYGRGKSSSLSVVARPNNTTVVKIPGSPIYVDYIYKLGGITWRVRKRPG